MAELDRSRDPGQRDRRVLRDLVDGARGDESAQGRAWRALLDGLAASLADAGIGLREAAERVVDVGEDALRDVTREGGRLAGAWRSEIEGGLGRLSRAGSTGWLLARIAGSYKLRDFVASFQSPEAAAHAMTSLHESNARRFSEASARSGGGLIKIGQMLSARRDLLPETWIRELQVLQDGAPSFSTKVARRVIEDDLGEALGDLFADFDEQPIAAASIGQVHRAVTHSGDEVAVKVQRPGIADLIEIDLDLLALTLDGMQSMLPPADYETGIAEVRQMVLGELDYSAEARLTDRVANAFETVPGVTVPHTLRGLCGPRVLVTHFVRGRKLTDVLDELSAARDAGDGGAGAELSRLLGLLLEAYLRQIFEEGLFQADPHPGNLLVTEDGELALLDFGCTRAISAATRKRYVALLLAFMRGDRGQVAALFEELGFATESGRPDTLHAFADALLTRFRTDGAASAWPTRDEILSRAADLLEAADEDPVVRIPAEFVMLARVLGTLGGLFQHYKPDLDYARHLVPILARA